MQSLLSLAALQYRNSSVCFEGMTAMSWHSKIINICMSILRLELHLFDCYGGTGNRSDSENASSQVATSRNTVDLQPHQMGSFISRRKPHMKFQQRRRSSLLAKVRWFLYMCMLLMMRHL